MNLAIAETDIFNKDEDIEQSKKLGLFEKSLLKNRPDFVEFFLEKSQSIDLKEFLDKPRLCKLYTVLKGDDPDSLILKNSPIYIMDSRLYNKQVELKDVKEFLQSRFRGFEPKFLADDSKNEPEINLFVWALLLNRIELAKIFWKIGKVNKNIYLKKNIFSKFFCNSSSRLPMLYLQHSF